MTRPLPVPFLPALLAVAAALSLGGSASAAPADGLPAPASATAPVPGIWTFSQDAAPDLSAPLPPSPAAAADDIVDADAEVTVPGTGTAAAAVRAASAPWWVTLLVVACVFILPFTISWLVGRAWRMKDVPLRLGLVLFLFALGLTPFLFNGFVAAADGRGFGAGVARSLKLGIDLAGGTNIVYQVDRDRAGEKEIDNEVMDQMVGAIAKRINPAGTEEVTVRRVGQDRIELIVPGADPEKVERLRRAATTLGQLEFLILVNQTDRPDLIQKANALPGNQREVRVGSKVQAAWKDVGRNKDGTLAVAPDGAGRTAYRFVNADGEKIDAPPEGFFDGEVDGVEAQVLCLLPANPERDRVTGEFLSRASRSRDERGGPAVGFSFTVAGSNRFARLTGRNLPDTVGDFKRRLAVVLDGELRSAPSINSVISSSGIIEGRFSQREVDELVDVFNAGALEVPLDPTPVSEATVSPLLGEDTVRKAVASILAAGVVVLLFMAAYYLVLGLVADLCLVLNIVLVMGVMSLIEATFTLPGLAGIVLTIGMAVDANVLIFERIREEQARGSSLRMSIRNGFAKAFTTIVDANVTTFITALILFLIGTDQVRGFAVTLIIGIATSVFTALYAGRLVCDILERKGWVKQFKMFSLVGDTDFKFISKSFAAVGVSTVLLACGVGLIAVRGRTCWTSISAAARW